MMGVRKKIEIWIVNGICLLTLATQVPDVHAQASSQASQATVLADVVITNAKIATPGPVAFTALAIVGDRIVAVGSAADIQPLVGPKTRRIDAEGCTVTPGFNDAHVHFLSGSLSLAQVDLAGAETMEELESRVVQFAKAHPNSTGIVGRGWVYGSFPGGLPDKGLLDRWIPDRPAIMKCYDGHTVWVNSKALEAANVTRSTADPAGGIIVRDPVSNEPTGVLKESAQALIEKVMPVATREDKLAALKAGIVNAHRFGVTSVQEAGVGLEELELFEALRRDGELNIRMTIALEARPNFSEADADRLDTLRRRFPGLKINAIKLYVDGVIESHTAALLAPYANRPSLGLPKTNQDELNRVVAMLDRRGWQIMIHAIGDGGIQMCMNAIEQAQQNAPFPSPSRGPSRRHRLEHIESISLNDIARFKQIGVVASMQPYHANPDGNVFSVWAVNLGAERASRAWVWKSIQDAGGRIAFGSDWPVVSIDPRLGMHVALTRQTLKGEPKEGFVPSQKLPLERIIDAYTRGAAFAEFEEDQKGTLAPGMLADIVIWNADLYALASDQVHKAAVRMVLFGGK